MARVPGARYVSRSLLNHSFVRVPTGNIVIVPAALRLLERAVPKVGLETAVEVCGEPPSWLQCVEEIHKRRRTEHALADVIPEVWFPPEECA